VRGCEAGWLRWSAVKTPKMPDVLRLEDLRLAASALVVVEKARDIDGIRGQAGDVFYSPALFRPDLQRSRWYARSSKFSASRYQDYRAGRANPDDLLMAPRVST